MKLGIKSGLLGDSLHDITVTRPEFTEIWFNITNSDAYEPLFEGLKKASVPAALHFWGITKDGYYPTCSYPDQELINESLSLMKRTIDIAANHHCLYVNIHPGVTTKTHLDFSKKIFKVVQKTKNSAIGEQLFFEHIQVLDAYAKSRGVLLTVETVPTRVVTPWHGPRNTPTTKMYEIPLETLQKAATLYGIAIANDFGHTAGNIIATSREHVWDFLRTHTKRMAPMTRLLHISFLEAPFNGTDFHDDLDNIHFLTGQTVPTYMQMQNLLQLFLNRNDVYALVEPPTDHQKNFRLLKNLVQKATSSITG